MKNLKALLLAVVAVLTLSVPAAAQFRIGPRIGTEVNSLRFGNNGKDMFNSDNRAGFTGGVQMEFTVPIVNLGFDLSVMYVHRVNNATATATATDGTTTLTPASSKDYIELPVNFKYKLGLPVIGKVFTPYIFTGPSFAFLTSKKAINEAFKSKSFDVAWNFGLGVQLFSHLQIGASYGLGITKAVEKLSSYQGQTVEGRNNYWTITAAWLF